MLFGETQLKMLETFEDTNKVLKVNWKLRKWGERRSLLLTIYESSLDLRMIARFIITLLFLISHMYFKFLLTYSFLFCTCKYWSYPPSYPLLSHPLFSANPFPSQVLFVFIFVCNQLYLIRIDCGWGFICFSLEEGQITSGSTKEEWHLTPRNHYCL